jgi:DHA1 family purine base/nucleoside efflux pump-like MFS transporter
MSGVGTSAYVVSGVLPAVSDELGVSLTAAGQLATAFALSYAIGAPLLTTVTGRWDRRTVLLAALTVAAVAAWCCRSTPPQSISAPRSPGWSAAS